MKNANILYLHSHDTGRYIEPYGYPTPTPNLQKFAESAVVFRQAFCAGPTCSPSRAALLTGSYPHNNGMLGLSHRGFSLNDYSQHILHTLRQQGYFCALSGVQHIDSQKTKEGLIGGRIGYDRILHLDETGREPDSEARVTRAVEFLSSKPATPFFLSVGFSETHRNFPEPDPEDRPDYSRSPAPLPDTPETRRDMAAFKKKARILDHKMGTILDALDKAGLRENTLVICTTDHGIAFPAMKCNLTDHGTGVMLMMRGPGAFAKPAVIDGMVSHIDVFPTLCDWLGIVTPAWVQGKSMIPLVEKRAPEIHDEIFMEVTFHASYEPMRAIRTQRWKYIRRFDGRVRPVLPNCDDSVSKDLWLAHGWRERPVPEELLFDLVFDPNEACNLAGNSAHAAIQKDLRARLDRWMSETRDPLLNGPVPLPPGGIANDPNSLSPKDRPISG